MADHNYTLLHWVALDAGSWAEWASGAMSFAAVATALLGYVIVARQRRKDNQKVEVQASISAFWKLLQVYNDTLTVAKHVREGLANDADMTFRRYRFARVQPLGIPPATAREFSADEVALLMRAKASDILMDLGDAFKRYDSIGFAMDEYRRRHEEIYKLMPRPVTMIGPTFTHQLTQEEFEKIEPYAHMLDTLLDSLIELIAEGVDKAQSLVDRYGPAMKKYFGKWTVTYDGDSSVADLTIFRSVPINQRPIH